MDEDEVFDLSLMTPRVCDNSMGKMRSGSNLVIRYYEIRYYEVKSRMDAAAVCRLDIFLI